MNAGINTQIPEKAAIFLGRAEELLAPEEGFRCIELA
jgi:hypothetical protein